MRKRKMTGASLAAPTVASSAFNTLVASDVRSLCSVSHCLSSVRSSLGSVQLISAAEIVIAFARRGGSVTTELFRFVIDRESADNVA